MTLAPSLLHRTMPPFSFFAAARCLVYSAHIPCVQSYTADCLVANVRPSILTHQWSSFVAHNAQRTRYTLRTAHNAQCRKQEMPQRKRKNGALGHVLCAVGAVRCSGRPI